MTRISRARVITGTVAGALLVAVGLVAGFAFGGTGLADRDVAPAASPEGTAEQARSMSSMMGMGQFGPDQPFDAQFLDQMRMHHQGAIMSTQAMIAGSSRPELRTLAQNIITSQRAQLAQMQAWRDQWYPGLPSTFGPNDMMGQGMMGQGMMGQGMMAGSGTDRMYLQMMIVHHQLAVDMGNQAQQQATHPELRELAATIAREQAAEIVQMRGYLADLAPS